MREGPLPDLPSRGDGPRRRFDGPPGAPREPAPPSVSDTASDWRSSRAPARTSTQSSQESEGSFRRRGPPSREPAPLGPADLEETWAKGAKFRPSGPTESSDRPERPGSRFGSLRRNDLSGPPSVPEESDWRRPRTISRNSTSRRSCLGTTGAN